jgi:membrane protein involved in colicin uptake
MTYEENRKYFKKNIRMGFFISVLLHLIIIIPFLFKGEDEIPTFKEGGGIASSAEIDLTNIAIENYSLLNEGGGGGGGGGTDPNGGGPLEEVKSGIPIPSSTPVKVEFGMVNRVPPDSASKNQNLKSGPGYGTGEGTGSGSGSGSGTGSGKGSGIGAGTGDGTVLLSFTPRQILEVIPQNQSNFKGIIKLSVKIGKDGLVKNHKILQNTSNSAQCLANVLEAVYRSKWQSVKIEGRIVEYWTEKTYRFE